MSGSKQKKKRANEPSSSSERTATVETSSAAAKPAVPEGARKYFLLAAFAFLASTGLPWARRASPIQWIASWVAHSDWSDRALALHMALPLLMLVAVASRETAPRVWSRMSVASMAFFSMTSFAIVSFGNSLPPRPHEADMIIYQDIPRVIRAYAGWASYALRALLFAPAALVAGWALAAKSTSIAPEDGTSSADRAPLANRILLALTAAGTTLVWAPRRGAWGYWVGLAASFALLVLAPLVEDKPAALDATKRKQASLALALWFVAFAALALTRVRRF
jgi:hypothetical protein